MFSPARPSSFLFLSVSLELPYSTEFGRESRKFASWVRKYGKFSQFLTYPVVYGGQGKNKYYLL